MFLIASALQIECVQARVCSPSCYMQLTGTMSWPNLFLISVANFSLGIATTTGANPAARHRRTRRRRRDSADTRAATNAGGFPRSP